MRSDTPVKLEAFFTFARPTLNWGRRVTSLDKALIQESGEVVAGVVGTRSTPENLQARLLPCQT
ncbi:hypothetical protein AC579_4398 [Pseudocercospora musae]|uniref:Uncharacterized protein n=1 Tax=Pseudocercospora musae TaxID=113226 RepID=A0A139IJY4_9PEZI|nr:hypothetical protein AC579_4398 [Pseudocercospora musae]